MNFKTLVDDSILARAHSASSTVMAKESRPRNNQLLFNAAEGVKTCCTKYLTAKIKSGYCAFHVMRVSENIVINNGLGKRIEVFQL